MPRSPRMRLSDQLMGAVGWSASILPRVLLPARAADFTTRLASHLVRLGCGPEAHSADGRNLRIPGPENHSLIARSIAFRSWPGFSD